MALIPDPWEDLTQGIAAEQRARAAAKRAATTEAIGLGTLSQADADSIRFRRPDPPQIYSFSPMTAAQASGIQFGPVAQALAEHAVVRAAAPAPVAVAPSLAPAVTSVAMAPAAAMDFSKPVGLDFAAASPDGAWSGPDYRGSRPLPVAPGATVQLGAGPGVSAVPTFDAVDAALGPVELIGRERQVRSRARPANTLPVPAGGFSGPAPELPQAPEQLPKWMSARIPWDFGITAGMDALAGRAEKALAIRGAKPLGQSLGGTLRLAGRGLAVAPWVALAAGPAMSAMGGYQDAGTGGAVLQGGGSGVGTLAGAVLGGIVGGGPVGAMVGGTLGGMLGGAAGGGLTSLGRAAIDAKASGDTGIMGGLGAAAEAIGLESEQRAAEREFQKMQNSPQMRALREQQALQRAQREKDLATQMYYQSLMS